MPGQDPGPDRSNMEGAPVAEGHQGTGAGEVDVDVDDFAVEIDAGERTAVDAVGPAPRPSPPPDVHGGVEWVAPGGEGTGALGDRRDRAGPAPPRVSEGVPARRGVS
ncbi:hypothetical protein GCM10027075_16950 [Streptomyces heilongjiangensis]